MVADIAVAVEDEQLERLEPNIDRVVTEVLEDMAADQERQEYVENLDTDPEVDQVAKEVGVMADELSAELATPPITHLRVLKMATQSALHLISCTLLLCLIGGQKPIIFWLCIIGTVVCLLGSSVMTILVIKGR